MILNGCSSIAPVTPMAEATRTFTPTILPAFTPTPFPQPSATQEYIKTQFLDLLPNPPADNDLHEGIVFVGPSNTYILDPRKDTRRTLTGNATGGAISPDGKWLAYYLFSVSAKAPSLSLAIESLDGKQKIKLPWDKRWSIWGGPFWLDNEHLMLNVLFQQDQTPPKTPEFPDVPSAVVINPFSGDRRYLASNYPDILSIEGKSPQFAFGNTSVIYNPALTLALYARQAIGVDPQPSIVGTPTICGT